MFQNTNLRYGYFCLLLLFHLFAASDGLPNTKTEAALVEKGPEYTSLALLETINETAAGETANLDKLKTRLQQQKALKKAASIEIDAYDIQNIVHTNLLLQPTTSTRSLERAHGDNKLVLKTINEKIKDFTKRRDTDTELLKQTQSQINLSENQAAEIEKTGWSKSEKTTLSSALGRLDRILKEKQRVLEGLIDGLGNLINQFETIRASASDLNAKLEVKIKSRQTRGLFNRKQTLPIVFEKGALKEEIVRLGAGLRKPFKKEFLIAEGRRLRESAAVSLLILFFLSTMAVVFHFKVRRFCLEYEKKHTVVETHRQRLLVIKLLRRSFIPVAILFVLYCYDFLSISHYRFPFHQLVVDILLVVLFTRWLLDYLHFRKPGATLFIPEDVAEKIARMIIWVRYFAIAYVIIHITVEEEGFILFVGRFFIEIYLVACCIVFWRAIRKANQPINDEPSKLIRFSTTSLIFLTYLIAWGGLAIELAGYSAFALYWLLSWARSLAVLLWAFIIFKAIMEWRAEHFPATTTDDGEPISPKYPIGRVFISFSWLLWFCGLIVTLALAWNTRHTVVGGIYTLLNKPFSIGKIGLNFIDVLVAVLVLFLTLILTRLGRYLITQKLFGDTDLEPGLQTSITTISTYVIWGLGVILALSIIGFSTTSLTVAFGALGIGLGFGLQAIFNNFISGIILLFERPIQVGDEVEINGVWSTVKKINVRATVVQTYDNASLIIPNSEFISSIVKNWSFSDKRLRRDIDVGVAYGSDVALVRRILLEIANKTPEIFKKPKPEVVFADFGDSALIFRLRIWTDIDNMIKVPTEIRFDIDRRFREQGIEIAFPQRDIHIRSTEGTTKFQIDRDLEK